MARQEMETGGLAGLMAEDSAIPTGPQASAVSIAELRRIFHRIER